MSAQYVKTLLSEDADHAIWKSRPHVGGDKIFRGGQIIPFNGPCNDVTSPMLTESNGTRIVIGKMAQNSEEDAERAFEAAKGAWNCGTGKLSIIPVLHLSSSPHPLMIKTL